MSGPILKCDRRAVVCCFWLLYPLAAVLILALLAKILGVR